MEVDRVHFKKVLAQFAQAASAKLSVQKSAKSIAGTFNKVDFFESDEMGGNVTKLAVSASRPEIEKTSVASAIAVQQLLLERGVDTRFLLTYLSYDENGTKESLQASEGSLRHYIDKHTGILTREEIKDIFGQLLLGIHALHEKGLASTSLGKICFSFSLR